jgi:hypothetical protein
VNLFASGTVDALIAQSAGTMVRSEPHPVLLRFHYLLLSRDLLPLPDIRFRGAAERRNP